MSLPPEMMEHSEIVAEGGEEALREIAELIVNRLPVKVLKPPAPGMVMVRQVDPLENVFFLLGETYVTECEVEVDGLLSRKDSPGHATMWGCSVARLTPGAPTRCGGNSAGRAQISGTSVPAPSSGFSLHFSM